MTKEDKYAVVADGEVVDTEPTKRAAAAAAKEVEAEEVVVVPVEEVEQAKIETAGLATDSNGITHIR